MLNGPEAVETLKVLEGKYQLFIVGKGKEEDSALTAGMSEREECPELGPIGNLLASSHFSGMSLVLVYLRLCFAEHRSRCLAAHACI